jgi:signal transduction histidine kinase
MIQAIRKKLNRKILTILAFALPLPMLAITYLSASFQARELIKHMTLAGDDIAKAIYGGIRYPMSVGDKDAIVKQLFDMRMEDVEVFISNYNQQITYATDKEMIGVRIDDRIYNQELWQQLIREPQKRAGREITFEEKIKGKKYLVMVQLIFNQPECTRCHGDSHDILGSMVVRMATDRTYAAITNNVRDCIFISVIGICAITIALYGLLTGSVVRPVKNLARVMRDLPAKIAAGGEMETPAVRREDEIADLEKTFHKMAVELANKRRQINKVNSELAAANKELQSFAYSVSHDLRAPLRNIDGFSKILLDEYSGLLDDSGRHYLQRVRSGTARMSQLIDDMLTFSRSGRQDLQLRELDTATMLDDVIKDFQEVITRRNISLHIGQLPKILGDAVLLKSVFANLISNAIKYTRDVAAPEIIVDFAEPEQAIYIRDNGIGFDMQYHDKIFQVFQRLQLPEDYEGTGIGLAIAYRIIERHHGAIWAQSEPGKGATFFVRLQVVHDKWLDNVAKGEYPFPHAGDDNKAG